MAEQRLPIVNSDDGVWGDIIRQFLMKEHYNTDVDNVANGGHQKITIRPGTSSAGTAPLKFTSGTLLTTPEAGAVEFNTDRLYFTQTTSTTRKTIATYDDSSGATGDMYYRDSSGFFSRFGIGSNNNFLTVSGGVPTWSSTLSTPTLTTPVINGTPTGTGVSTSATANTLALRDGNANLFANNLVNSYTTTTTSASAVTLTVSSTNLQVFTGSTAQTVNLPTTSVVAGMQYRIVNNSSATVTVNASGGTTVVILAANTSALFTALAAAPTTNTQWDAQYWGTNVASGKTLTVSRTLTLTGTDSTTMTFPSTSATIARTDAAQTFTGVQTLSSSPVLSTGAVTVSSNTITFPTTADTLVGKATTDTLTNKTINLSNNTLTGTTAQFNTALSDGDFATTSDIANKADIKVVPSGDLLEATALNMHPESVGFTVIPNFMNDIAYNILRGGSISVTKNGSALTDGVNYNSANWFTPDGAFAALVPTATTDTFVITVTLHTSFQYGTYYGIVMADGFMAKDVTIEGFYSSAWTTLYTTTNNTSGRGTHWKQYSANAANGISQLRFTLTNLTSASSLRITSLFVITYSSSLASEGFFNRGGGALYGTNAAPPAITASGSDTNISLNLVPKGTGRITANGVNIPTISSTDTLTNKTLTTPIISSISNTGTLTLPTSTDTLVGRATTDTLTNKTISGASNTLSSIALSSLSTTGTASSTTFLRGDGQWTAISTGDASTNTSTSVDGEVVLFNGTTGKSLKRATGSGIATLTSGVLSATATTGSGNVVLATSPTITTPVLNGVPSGTGVATAPTASTLALRDANSNLSTSLLILGFTTTATAAGTTTLTMLSNQLQIFTGTSTQTVVLPTTSVVAGTQFRVVNNSTGAVTVQSSGLNTIVVLAANTSALLTALVATPTTAANWDAQYWASNVASGKTLTVSNSVTLAGTDGTTMTFPGSSDTVATLAAAQTLTNKTISGASNTLSNIALSSLSTTGTANSSTYLRGDGTWSSAVAQLDANNNFSADTFLAGFRTQATAGTTTTLTINDTQIQEFTGSSNQTLTLPTTSVPAGAQYYILNNSTGTITVNASGGATVVIMAAGTNARFTALVATPTTAANWDGQYFGGIYASGKKLNINNSLTLAGTDGTTMTFPGSSDTVVTLAATQTLSGKTISGSSNTLSNIANSSLTNSAITIAGTSTALGGSITQDTITGLSSTGIVKRTGANTLGIAVAGDFPTLNQNTTGSAASFTGSLAGDVSGTQSATSVDKVKGVTFTAGAATVASQLNNAAARSATATLSAGEETVFTGTTASQTLTLPSAPQNSTLNSITNISTQSVTLAPGGTDTLNYNGTTGNLSIPVGGSFTLVYITATTTWYVTNNDQLAVTGSGSTVLATSPTLSSPTLSGTVAGTPTWASTQSLNTSGSAATLTTGRTIQTNLASTSSATFNGSANVTPGVTGTLPVGNGGTGATTLTGIVKGNGTSAFTAAVAGTDYASPSQTMNIGTTSVAINRASANLALTGISSVTMPGSTSGTAQIIPAAAAGTGTVLTLPAVTGNLVGTGDTGTVTNTMLAGSIAIGKLGTTGTPSTSTYLRGDYQWVTITAGDASTNTSSTTANQLAVFANTTGKLLTGATGSGIATLSSGVLSTVTAPSGAIVGTSDTQTLTNKRVTVRIDSTASSATPAINTDTTDQYNITALAVSITSMTSGLSGTPTDGQKLMIRIKDNGTSRGITWGTSFTSSGTATLPTLTAAGKTHHIGLIWDAAVTKWVCIAADGTGY